MNTGLIIMLKLSLAQHLMDILIFSKEVKRQKHRYDPVQGRGEENGSKFTSKRRDAFSPCCNLHGVLKIADSKARLPVCVKTDSLKRGYLLLSISASCLIPGTLLQASQPSHCSSGTCCKDTAVGDETFLKSI